MAGGWMDKMKDYVKGNPDQAGSAIKKVEDLIDQKTGGKYADKVDKGGDVLRDKLGLPGDDPAATVQAGPASSGDRDAGSTDPVQGSVPNPQPGTNDPQPTGSIAEGSLVPGDNERVGQPGGPMDPEHPAPGQPLDAGPSADLPGWGAPGETTPDVGGDTSTQPTQPSQHQDGLPQGGSTQQGEPQSDDAVPGGKQPDDGGPGRQ